MKKKYNLPVIRSVAVAVLVGSICIGWSFSRQDFGSGEVPDSNAPNEVIRTKAEPRPSATPKKERPSKEEISDAVQERYVQLLELYPDMKPEFRDVPDEENGFLQFLLLAESKEISGLPKEIEDMFFDSAPWDAAKFEAWLAENKDALDKILRIADLPDRSAKGVDFDRFANGVRQSGIFGEILNGSARLAFEKGDQAAALRYAQASMSLGEHLTEVEVPSMLGKVIAQGYRVPIQDLFVESMLPSLAGDPHALHVWREALFPKQDTSGDYSRLLTGEWNIFLRENILPAMLGAHSNLPEAPSFEIPEPDTYLQQYTEATRRLAANFSKAGPGRIDLSQTELQFPESGIEPQTLRMLNESSALYRGIYKALGNRITQEAMISAAIAIQLGEEPGVDPVSGNPFQFDQTTRTLTEPEGSGESHPIKIP